MAKMVTMCHFLSNDGHLSQADGFTVTDRKAEAQQSYKVFNFQCFFVLFLSSGQ